MKSQSEKSISELLGEIGVSHSQSKFYGCRTLNADCGVIIDEMDAGQAAHFYRIAQCAA